MSSFKKLVQGSMWGIAAKIFDAVAKFITIPLLVSFYGKADYGLVALAFSLNTYLRLMDMGLNIGSIRFFSMWIANKEFDKISKVSRSTIVFYGVIGLINALIFVFIGEYPHFFFNLQESQAGIFRWMMYILAASTVFNWLSNVAVQLLSANGQVGYVNSVTIFSSLTNLLAAVFAIRFNLSLPAYFIWYTLSTMVIIPFYVYKLKEYPMSLPQLISPKWDGKAFKEISGYSITIFAMAVFQFSADNLRPLLLGKFASKGIEVLTDYRIIQTITALIGSFGAIFLQVLLPSASRVLAENNIEKKDKLVYSGTKYISLFISFMVFVLALNATSLLQLYMGDGYGHLSLWLIIWLISLLGMHNGPIASLVLSGGNTKPVAIMSFVSCVVSLPITYFFAAKYNVGAAVIGYFVYICMQVTFYYSYCIPKVLKMDARRIFWQSFFPSVAIGLISMLSATVISRLLHFPSVVYEVAFKTLLFTAIYLMAVLISSGSDKDIKDLIIKFKPVKG